MTAVLLTAFLLSASPVDRAAAWMAKFPTEELRFDAAIVLSEVLKLSDSAALREEYARARRVADEDDDNPSRHFFDPDAGVKKETLTRWKATDPKVNTNRPVDEALWCDVHGLRPQTLAYASGPMRDGGGYRSTHALWVLVLARERGCLDVKAFEKASGPVRAELREAQPEEPDTKPLDIDLYAERLLMLLLAGERDATLERWGQRLTRRQNDDGSFGPRSAVRYEQYHATMMSAWALALLTRPSPAGR